jgi:hypothetical protein
MKVTFNTIPCNIIEHSVSFTPLSEQGAVKLAAAAPVMPGTIEVTALINAEFEYFA